MIKIIKSKYLLAALAAIILIFSLAEFFFPINNTYHFKDIMANPGSYAGKIAFFKWYTFGVPLLSLLILIVLTILYFVIGNKTLYVFILIGILFFLMIGWIFLGLMNDYDWYILNV